MISRKRSFLYALMTGYGHMGSSILVQLLLVPLYLSTLGTEAFGVLMMFLSFFNFANMGIAWMSAGALRLLGEAYAAEDREQLARTYRLSHAIYVCYALIIGAAMAMGVALYGAEIFELSDLSLAADLPVLALLAAAYFVLMYDAAMVRMPLIAATQQATSNMLQIVSTVLFAATAVVLLLTGYGLVEVFIALVASQAFASVAGRVVLARRHLFTPCGLHWNAQTKALFKRLLGRQGAGFFAYGMVSIALQGDIFIIGLIGGAEMAAVYTLIWKIAEVAATLISRIPESLSPYLISLDAKKEYATLKRLLPRGYAAIAVLGLAGGVIYATCGQWMVEMWVGEAAAPGDEKAYWLAGGMLFWITLTRLPITLALATVRLRLLLITASAELIAKWVIVLMVFEQYGYISLLIAGNATHAFGVAFAYALIIVSYYREAVNKLKNSEN